MAGLMNLVGKTIGTLGGAGRIGARVIVCSRFEERLTRLSLENPDVLVCI